MLLCGILCVPFIALLSTWFFAAGNIDVCSAKTAQGGAEILSQPYRLYNLDVFEYAIDHPMGLYGAIPFLMSHGGESTTGIFWLNSAEMFVDVHETADKSLHTHWYAESGVIDVFLYAGDTPADVLAQFVETTGKPYMPPLFSVAYHQCRWNYKNEKDVAQVDGKFDEHDIPFDVLWLDIEHTDGKRYFTWDKTHFPTPVAMQERLAVKGRKMVTIIDPHIKIDEGFPVYREAREKGYFVKNAQGSEFQGDCWPGRSAWLDYTDERVRQYWAELFSYDRYQGSSPTLFTWNDMNEPAIFSGPEATMDKDAKHLDGTEHREVHNQYGFLQAMSTVQGQRLRAPTERPFVLSRSFFAGSQKYHAVWTGDNMAKWDHLRAGQHMLLTLGLSALPFVGADVGGFFYNPDPELLVRWYQAGAYYPFFRAHAHIETKRREPWLFGDENTARIRDAIRARYHLLPYVYTVFRISHETGLPVMRPLFLQYPRQVDLFGVYDQFLVGADVMVAPVLSAGAATVDVVVPDGSVWFQVPTGKKFTEGKHSVPVDMSGIPVFYRGGSIVPKKERLRRSSALMVHDPYTLVVSLDANRAAQGKLYLDDGHSTAFERGEAAVVTFTLDTHGALTASKVGSFACDNKVERIVFYGAESAPRAIRVGDRALESTFSDGVLTVRKPDVAVTGGWTMTISWT